MTTTTDSGIKVQSFKIIGTDVTVYAAYEALDGHSATMTIDGVTMGRIGTSRLPAEIDALPAMTGKRVAAVEEWHATEYERAYAAILEVQPRLGFNDNATLNMGEARTTRTFE